MRSHSLTIGQVAFVALLDRYVASGFDDSATRLEAPKLAYFLQAAGEPLRLRNVAHRYGPYADNLRKVLEKLEGHYLRGYADGSPSPETPLRLLPETAEAARQVLTAHPEIHERFERVARRIDSFETPLGMELMATVHWVAHHDPFARNFDEATVAVNKWSTRSG